MVDIALMTMFFAISPLYSAPPCASSPLCSPPLPIHLITILSLLHCGLVQLMDMIKTLAAIAQIHSPQIRLDSLQIHQVHWRRRDFLLRKGGNITTPSVGKDSTKSFTIVAYQINLHGLLKTNDLIKST